MMDRPGSKGTEAQDEDIRRLLALAGPRVAPPADVEARVRAATMAAFDALPEPLPRAGGRTAVRGSRWALAAGLVLALAVGWLVSRPADLPPVGEVLFATGGYTVRGSEDDVRWLAAGSILRTSGEGRLLVALSDSLAIRVDRGSSLTLHSTSEVWLHGGRVYVDARDGPPLTVVTPFASVTDVGTQFEVGVDGERLTVATREGRVDVRLGNQTLVTRGGSGRAEEVLIEGLDVVTTRAIATSGSRWAWTQAARPRFVVTGRSVRDYLEWAAREAGRELRFATALAGQQAALKRLGGSGEVDADPESVERLLAATSFRTLPAADHELVVTLVTDRD